MAIVGSITLPFPFEASAEVRQPPPEACSLSVASLNMAKESDLETVLRGLREIPALRRADLLLLQEVANPNDETNLAEQVAHRLGYFATFAPAAPGVRDQGLAIVSRYPIKEVAIHPLKACNLRFRSRTRFAIAGTVETPCGHLRVWNAHLDTRVNPGERLEQLAPVLAEAESRTGPRLIGGDLNTNNFYWLGNMLPLPGGSSQRSAVRQAMEQHSFRPALTNAAVTFPLFRQQLDWIFVNQLESLASGVAPVAFSDHHAVWTVLRIPESR